VNGFKIISDSRDVALQRLDGSKKIAVRRKIPQQSRNSRKIKR